MRSWLLLIDKFWFVSAGPGAESNVLFDDVLNTLEFDSDSGLLKVDVGIGLGVEVVFNLAWISGINDDNGVKEEFWLDNKFLITNFINSGLKPEDMPETGRGVKDVIICWRGVIELFDWLCKAFDKQGIVESDDEQAGEIVCGFIFGTDTGVTFGACIS